MLTAVVYKFKTCDSGERVFISDVRGEAATHKSRNQFKLNLHDFLKIPRPEELQDYPSNCLKCSTRLPHRSDCVSVRAVHRRIILEKHNALNVNENSNRILITFGKHVSDG